MVDLAVSGPISSTLDALRTLVANVPAFQTWTEATSSSEAIASVFVGEMGWPILSIAIASGVMTVTLREIPDDQDSNGIAVDSSVTIQGTSLGAQAGVNVDGEFVVTGGMKGPPFQFTATVALPDAATFFPDQAFVIPGIRPLAVVSEGDDGGVKADVVWGGGGGIYSGSCDIFLEADVSSTYQNDGRNALTEARNALGNLVQGLIETQGTGDLMILNDVTVAAGVQFLDRAEADDNTARYGRWRALLRVSWGVHG